MLRRLSNVSNPGFEGGKIYNDMLRLGVSKAPKKRGKPPGKVFNYDNYNNVVNEIQYIPVPGDGDYC